MNEQQHAEIVTIVTNLSIQETIDIPDWVWEELNKRYVINVSGNRSALYTVDHKIFNRTELRTNDKNEVIKFYKEEAEKIEQTLEEILLEKK